MHEARPRREHLAVARARATTGPDRARSASSTTSAGSTSTTCARCSRSERRSSRSRWASNAVGTVTPVAEIVELAHEAGALAWVDAVHYAPHGADRDRRQLGCDVLLCSPYKFYGPHLGLAWVRRELAESWRPYKVRPAADEPVAASGTRRARSRTSCSAGFVACVEYLRRRRLGVHPRSTSARSGSGSSTGCPTAGRCTAPPAMEGRVPTFAINADGESPRRTPPPASARARLRGVGRQLLRGRGHSSSSASPTARSASGSSTRTPRTRSTGCSRSCPA